MSFTGNTKLWKTLKACRELFLPIQENCTKAADEYLKYLEMDKGQRSNYKAVSKALRLMSTNLRHPSLATHDFHSKLGPNGETIFETDAQNKTPGAHRIFWYYGPGKRELTVVAITPHP